MFDSEEICNIYLGVTPVKGQSLIGSEVKLKWLREYVLPLGVESIEEQLHTHCKASILGLIGGVLMPDKIWKKVYRMYLPFFTNLCRTRRYSWGSTYLDLLYRELCRTIDAKAKIVGVHRLWNHGHGIACHTSCPFPHNNLSTH